MPVEKVLPTLEEVQQKIIEKLSNDLVNLTESKGKMEKELNDKVQGKERLHQEKLNLETFKLNDVIGKLKYELQGLYLLCSKVFKVILFRGEYRC